MTRSWLRKASAIFLRSVARFAGFELKLKSVIDPVSLRPDMRQRPSVQIEDVSTSAAGVPFYV
jgi:hypothetical protein